MFATGLALAMQLMAAMPAVTVMEATIVVEPESTMKRVFRFAPGDEILVTVEALKQELAESQKGDNAVGNAVVAGLSVLLPPKVGSASLGPIDADPIAQAGDQRLVELQCVTATGGPHWLAISGRHEGCRSTYRVTVKRRPATQSLCSFDTRVTPSRIDTVIDPIFEGKQVYVAEGTMQYIPFEIPGDADRIVVVAANEESYNALTSGFASGLASIALSAALEKPTPVDLSSIRLGKDFGYSVEAYSGTLKQWVPVATWARIHCDKTLIKPSERQYKVCRIQLDNSYSRFTAKTVKLSAYSLKLKPVYSYEEPPASPAADVSADERQSQAGDAGSNKYRVVVYANDDELGQKVLDVVKVAGFAKDESCVIHGANGNAYIKYGAASADDVRTMRKLVSRLYDGTLVALNEFDSDDHDVFINLP